MDTIGSLVDQMTTVNTKMWYAQEDLYKIRKMSEWDFVNIYSDPEKLKELYATFKKGIDLNLQRNALIDAVDEKLIEMIKSAINGEDLDNGKWINRKNKTY